MSSYITSIGLDVHAHSITAAAFNPFTGEIITKRFDYSPAEIAEWILEFEEPKAVYESGVTGYAFCRALKALGVDCIIGAVSKMQKPAADKRKKNDRQDAIFLARLLASHNIVEVMLPDEECEAMRDIARVLEDVREDLIRAKHRLTKFLMRHGHVFNERNSKGVRINNWTKAFWSWIREIDFDYEADQDAFAYYISEVKHLEQTKKQIENWIRKYSQQDRWRNRVDALRCLKGIETMTAFAIVVEANVFTRFSNASEFAAWIGLVPSEHSSGEKTLRGGITKAGNSHLRKLFVESAWHYVGASPKRKCAPTPAVSLSIENHAAKATKRLITRRRHFHEKNKKPVVANCATARELACWCWAIGRMSEGTL